MQQLNLVKNGTLQLQNCAKPEYTSKQCLIETKFCGVCSTDIYRSHSNGAYFYPLVMGHEISGIIKNIGDEVTKFSIDDKVAIFPLIPCFSGLECDKGNYVLCHNYSYHGSRCSGGYADFMAVNEWNIIKVPDQIELRDAAFLEPTAVVLHVIRRSGAWNNNKKRILIIGAGFLGLLLVQMLLIKNPQHELYVLDRNKFKLNRLPKGVVGTTSADELRYRTFDLLFEGTGSSDVINLAIDSSERGGTICFLGNPLNDLHLPKKHFSNILRKELTLLGSWNSTFRHDSNDDWSMALEMMKNGLHPSQLVSHHLTLPNIDSFLKKCWYHKTGVKSFPHLKGLVEF